MDQKASFFLECYELGIIKFGKFTLKSGIESPFYVDLRPLASDPAILKKLASFLLAEVKGQPYDLICGVPYAALPMATAMSLQAEKPLIIKRKEAKAYGTKKLLEGIFFPGQTCLVVEDVITSGKSLLETIPEIKNEQIEVTDIVVVLDRQQGGRQRLEDAGYRVHTLFTISEACDILAAHGKISDVEHGRIQDFIRGNPVQFQPEKRLSYEDKLKKVSHPVAKALLSKALAKKSNLIASADVQDTASLLRLADQVGPHIIALKTHVDILSDFEYAKTILPLKELAKKHDFLLMEDRKFADIGNTQELQFSGGSYRIADWADFVTVHPIAGAKSMHAFNGGGAVSIIEMSTAGTLTDASYQQQAIKISLESEAVFGGVSQSMLPEELLHFTPGVSLSDTGDDKGQQYNTPQAVFEKQKTDFIIVGRGIYRAENAAEAAARYQNAGWQAYLASVAGEATV